MFMSKMTGHEGCRVTYAQDVGHGYAMAGECFCGQEIFSMGSCKQAATRALNVKWHRHINQSLGAW